MRLNCFDRDQRRSALPTSPSTLPAKPPKPKLGQLRNRPLMLEATGFAMQAARSLVFSHYQNVLSTLLLLSLTDKTIAR